MSAPLVERYNDGDEGTVAALPKEIVPLQRMGDDQDMAGAILYLASRGGLVSGREVPQPTAVDYKHVPVAVGPRGFRYWRPALESVMGDSSGVEYRSRFVIEVDVFWTR